MTDQPRGWPRRPTPSYLDQDLGGFLDSVARAEPAPGGGSVAAVTASLAAALVEMAARYSRDLLDDGDRIIEEAERLRRRAAELSDIDALAYARVIAASSSSADEDRARRREETRLALHEASEVPLEIAHIGAETAKLAARLVNEGKRSLRGDAAAALFLAEAATRAAAHLVSVNVETGGGDRQLVRGAEASVDLACEALRMAHLDMVREDRPSLVVEALEARLHDRKNE